MSCGDVLVRRSCVSSLALKKLQERLGYGFRVLEAWVEDVATVMAMVQRVRDGKHYLAILHLDSDVLELRARG